MTRDGPLRLVFFLSHPGLLRFFGPVVELLAERGHEVQLAFSGATKSSGDISLADDLVAAHPGITVGAAPQRNDLWRPLAGALRGLMDVARYAHPRFAGAPKLRARVVRTVAAQLRVPGSSALLGKLVEMRTAYRLIPALGAMHRAIPSSRRIDAFLRAARPDAVLVSPVVDFGSGQVELLRSAHALGIPSAICVASWDNLTGKGLLRTVPDRVFVWNEIQRLEAVELHGIPPDRVVATGAPKFDEWFERGPGTTSEEFAAKVGLPGPFILYLCSSPFIAPDEVSFVRDWLQALRGRTAAPVLVRPHPQNAAQWRHVDLREFAPVSVWPRGGAQPDSGEDRADFYDSLAHATAVVGVNTSGLIEAAIVGRPVFTILDERLADTQLGTLHFHYLRAENGGFLHEARSFDDHLEQLLGADEDGEGDRARRFVASFVRPGGLDRSATAILVDEIESLVRS
jgi:hypothetical protein